MKRLKFNDASHVRTSIKVEEVGTSQVVLKITPSFNNFSSNNPPSLKHSVTPVDLSGVSTVKLGTSTNMSLSSVSASSFDTNLKPLSAMAITPTGELIIGVIITKPQTSGTIYAVDKLSVKIGTNITAGICFSGSPIASGSVGTATLFKFTLNKDAISKLKQGVSATLEIGNIVWQNTSIISGSSVLLPSLATNTSPPSLSIVIDTSAYVEGIYIAKLFPDNSLGTKIATPFSLGVGTVGTTISQKFALFNGFLVDNYTISKIDLKCTTLVNPAFTSIIKTSVVKDFTVTSSMASNITKPTVVGTAISTTIGSILNAGDLGVITVSYSPDIKATNIPLHITPSNAAAVTAVNSNRKLVIEIYGKKVGAASDSLLGSLTITGSV